MKMDYIYESKKDFRKGETKNSPMKVSNMTVTNVTIKFQIKVT